jgi:NAD(P)-dependent dehydrogenase (short-subunit alcohol dehydrogenase family)
MTEKTLRYRKWRQQHLQSLAGKTAIITGANSGIGFETARGLLDLGAHVVLACRNEGRAAAARQRLLAEFPEAFVEVALLDLASFASIDAFAENMAKRYEKIHIFVHSAGVYYPRDPRTADGLPTTVGVNFVGTVRLAQKVLPLMDGAGRMIFTTSLTDRFGRVRGGDTLAADKTEGYPAYARSKHLLSAYVCRAAATRKAEQPAFFAVHPGITATELLSADKTTHKPLFSRIGHDFLYLFTHSPEKAALTTLWAAAGHVENGACIGPRGIFGISGYPHRTRFAPSVRKRARISKKSPK